MKTSDNQTSDVRRLIDFLVRRKIAGSLECVIRCGRLIEIETSDIKKLAVSSAGVASGDDFKTTFI